jgi:high-affinity Fe2+/Pb2+ permease
MDLITVLAEQVSQDLSTEQMLWIIAGVLAGAVAALAGYIAYQQKKMGEISEKLLETMTKDTLVKSGLEHAIVMQKESMDEFKEEVRRMFMDSREDHKKERDLREKEHSKLEDRIEKLRNEFLN